MTVLCLVTSAPNYDLGLNVRFRLHMSPCPAPAVCPQESYPQNCSVPYTTGSTCTASGCGWPYWQWRARRKRKSWRGGAGTTTPATTTTATTNKCQDEDAKMMRYLVYPLVEIVPLMQWRGRNWRCRQHLDESVGGSADETLDRCVVYELHFPRE